MKEEQKKWLWAGILLSVSLALRIFRLTMSFWMDEIITVTQFVPKPWLKIITEVTYPNNHLLYTLFAKLSILVFGEKEWSARLPAMIFGSITLPIFYLILRRRFSDLVAFGAGLFLALNFWSVWFSQDARGYSAFILFSFLSNWFFLEYLNRPLHNSSALMGLDKGESDSSVSDSDKINHPLPAPPPSRGRERCFFRAFFEPAESKLAVGYIVVSVLSVWFYLYALFLIGAQLLYALNRWRRKKAKSQKLIPVFASAIFGISLYLPSLAELWRYAESADKMSALHPVNLLFFQDLLLMLAGTRKMGIAIFFLVISLPGFFYLLEKERGFIAINLLAGLGIILFSAFFHFFIYPRFLIFLLPVFALGVGFSTKLPSWILLSRSTLLSKILSYLMLSAIVLFLIPGLVNYYAFGKQGFKDAAEYLKKHQGEKELICYGIICEELKYYYSGAFEQRSEKRELKREMIEGRRIISRSVDWRRSHLELVKQFCYTEKVWRSAGYRENMLILFNCQ